GLSGKEKIIHALRECFWGKRKERHNIISPKVVSNEISLHPKSQPKSHPLRYLSRSHLILAEIFVHRIQLFIASNQISGSRRSRGRATVNYNFYSASNHRKDPDGVYHSDEEVLLENVELILEAFDYLQLPFTFRKGCLC
ncbi:phenylalanine--tRNA ligase alpha subunit, partial [Striga asiatica]